MVKYGKRLLRAGILLLGLFVVWTVLVSMVDVREIGEAGLATGFASVNNRFHDLTGLHMGLYVITDWLGLVPVMVGLLFAGVGFCQMIRRRSILRVDGDILLLGAYYAIVLLAYLAFEIFPVNYRPVLIEGRIEASYPSSTTLLVLSVMPTLVFQAERRMKRPGAVRITAIAFSLFMTAGRTVSGVHWLTDIVGSVLLSGGLFYVYKGAALMCMKKTDGRV